jgi:hypothetical protein
MTKLEEQLLVALKAQIQMRNTMKPTKLDEALTWRENDLYADKLAEVAISEYNRIEKAGI